MVNEILFWKKYRPSKIEDLILPDRIRLAVKDGIKTNLILHGPFGCGKTTLSKLLIKDHPHLYLNSSLYTSIDILRNKVEEFCSKMSMFDTKNEIKIVFLDEVDRISKQYQDALKGFIEEYENTVRFIATTNHINKIDGGIKSRFILLDFNPQSNEEEKYLKSEQAKRIRDISAIEDISLSKENIISIINRNYPDVRQMVTVLQHIKATGQFYDNVTNFNDKLKEDTYKMILDKYSYDDIYHFLMTNYGAEKIDELIQILGRPFIEWVIVNRKDVIPKLGKVSNIVTKHNHMLSTSIDPIVLGISLVSDIIELG